MAAKFSRKMNPEEEYAFGSTDHIVKNGDSSVIDLATGTARGRRGWFVTPAGAFIIVLAALALAAIVGLIVGLEHPDRGKTSPVVADPKKTATITASTTTAITEAPPIDVRLPDTLLPTHYNVRLRPDIYTGNPDTFQSTGSVEIFLNCTRATNVITLHSRSLQITEDQVTVVNIATGASIAISHIEYQPDIVEFLMIHLSSDLKANSQYKVTFGHFIGEIADDLRGIYYSSYLDNTGNIQYLLTSQFQAVDGRKVFPCMDEPNLKATFNMTIERLISSGYHSMSNMEIVSSEVVPGETDWMADHFGPTPSMSLYLLAVTISDFRCVTNTTADGLEVDVCSRPNAFDQTQFASTIAAPMQDWLAGYNDLPFPLNKNTHLAVPDFAAGAMENWGLITYRETALLFEPSSSTSSQRQRVAAVVSHELAHMWFGNLVTMKWWDDVWLNEGFASYMEYRGVDAVFPTWNMDADFVLNELQRALPLDALPTSHPVYVEVNDPAQISQLFDTITYSKGSSVIRMMRNFLGEETFKRGLSNYLKDRAYQEATHQDLFTFLTQQARDDGKDIDVHAVMNTWILQLGYPVVTFHFDRAAGMISMTQEQFLLDPKSSSQLPPSRFNYIWEVPVTIATDLNDQDYWFSPEVTWLNTKTGTVTGVPTNAKWVMGNLNAGMYYRMNYDADTWTAIQEQLAEDHTVFPVNSRTQLIDDAFNLGRAGIIEQTVAMEICTYLGSEKDLFPWRSFSKNIDYFAGMLVVTGSYGYLEKYVQEIIQDVYNDTLWDDTTLDPITGHVARRTRSLILSLACNYGHDGCIRKAHDQFQAWMASSGDNPIDPDLRPVVYCTGLAAGGVAEWEFAFAKLGKSNSGAESRNLITALGCTKENWLLRRYMEEALAERAPLRRQNFGHVFRAVGANSRGRNIAWTSFVGNYDTLFERFGASSFAFDSIVNYMTYKFSSQYDYDQVKRFRDTTDDLGTAENAFNQALDKIKVNIAWQQNNQKHVVDWLKARYP